LVTVDDVLQEVERNWGPCAAMYYHGSTIFGNKKPTDIDLLAVVDEPTLRPVKAATTDAQFSMGPFEVSVYTRSFWLRKLEEMDLTMLTCLSLPPHFVVRSLDDDRAKNLQIDIEKLSEAIISYAEYTWLKARRVLLQWKDAHKSSKNVYFVFRVLEFGRQLVTHGGIVDFTAANPWWEHIENIYTSLGIQPKPLDWEIVQAVLAGDFQQERDRFLGCVSAKQSGSEEVPEPGEPGPCVCEQSTSDRCAVCLDSLRPDSTSKPCTLASCGHTFHPDCIAQCIRSNGGSSCPLCRQPIVFKLDEENAVARELERRGIFEGSDEQRRMRAQRQPRRFGGQRRRRYGGYPATVLLEEEPTPPEEEPTADAPTAEDVAGPAEEHGPAEEELAPGEEEPLETTPVQPFSEPEESEESAGEAPAAEEREALAAEEHEEREELEEPEVEEPAAAEEVAVASSSGSSLGEWEIVEEEAAHAEANPAPQTRVHCSIT